MQFKLLISAGDEIVEKFKDPTKIELTCQGSPEASFDAMVISATGGLF